MWDFCHRTMAIQPRIASSSLFKVKLVDSRFGSFSRNARKKSQIKDSFNGQMNIICQLDPTQCSLSVRQSDRWTEQTITMLIWIRMSLVSVCRLLAATVALIMTFNFQFNECPNNRRKKKKQSIRPLILSACPIDRFIVIFHAIFDATVTAFCHCFMSHDADAWPKIDYSRSSEECGPNQFNAFDFFHFCRSPKHSEARGFKSNRMWPMTIPEKAKNELLFSVFWICTSLLNDSGRGAWHAVVSDITWIAVCPCES